MKRASYQAFVNYSLRLTTQTNGSPVWMYSEALTYDDVCKLCDVLKLKAS